MFYIKRDVPKPEQAVEKSETPAPQGDVKHLTDKVESLETMVKTIVFNSGDDN